MRVRNGKIAEHWGVANLFSLMQQLGAWPASKEVLAADFPIQTSTIFFCNKSTP
jgi:hypothetical protein